MEDLEIRDKIKDLDRVGFTNGHLMAWMFCEAVVKWPKYIFT